MFGKRQEGLVLEEGAEQEQPFFVESVLPVFLQALRRHPVVQKCMCSCCPSVYCTNCPTRMYPE